MQRFKIIEYLVVLATIIMNSLQMAGFIRSLTIQKDVTVVQMATGQGICKGNSTWFWKKNMYSHRIADMIFTLFANMTDMFLKGETSVKHYSKLAKFIDRVIYILRNILSSGLFALLVQPKQYEFCLGQIQFQFTCQNTSQNISIKGKHSRILIVIFY